MLALILAWLFAAARWHLPQVSQMWQRHCLFGNWTDNLIIKTTNSSYDETTRYVNLEHLATESSNIFSQQTHRVEIIRKTWLLY